MKIENINKITLRLMLVIIVAQIFAPTIYRASEVSAKSLVDFATLNDFIFDEKSEEYGLHFYADEEVSIDFTYDENAGVDDYNFNFNNQQIDIKQAATTKIGENEIIINAQTESPGDISSLKLNVASENLKHVSATSFETSDNSTDVQSEQTDVQVETNSDVVSDELSSETSELDQEVTSEQTTETTTEQYVTLNLTDLWENSKASTTNASFQTYNANSADVVNGPIGDVITLLNDTDAKSYCEALGYTNQQACDESNVTVVNSDFAISTARDFKLNTQVYIREQGTSNSTENNNTFGIFFAGDNNASETPESTEYGIKGLTNTNGIVLDQKNSQLITVNTNDNGKLISNIEATNENYALNNESFNRYDYSIDFDAASNTLTTKIETYQKNGDDWKLVATDEITDLLNGASKLPTNEMLYLKMIATEGQRQSEVRLANFEFKGYVNNIKETTDSQTSNEQTTASESEVTTTTKTTASESEVTATTKTKAAEPRADDFEITKEFVGAKVGGIFAANDDVLTWRLILHNMGTVKTNVRAMMIPDPDDVVGTIFDVVVDKNGETLVEGTDYTVKNNEIKLLDSVGDHDTITIDYSENTVSEFNDTKAMLDKSFIYADGFANPKQVLKYVGKLPSNAHEMIVHKAVLDRSLNDKAAFGEKLMYTITVQNTGQVNETNVHIVDIVNDPNLDLSTIKLNAIKVENGATITSSTVNSTDGVDVVADMPKGSNVIIKFYIDVKSSGIRTLASNLLRGLNKNIENSVSVNADLIPDPLSDTVLIPIDYDEPGMNDLTIDKTLESTTDGDMLADINEDLNFKLTVENKGALVQENVVLTDTPSGEFNGEFKNLVVKNGDTTLVEGTDYTFDTVENTIIFSSIDSNTRLTITYTLKTDSVFNSADQLMNTVTANSDELTEAINSEVFIEKDVNRNAIIGATDAQTDLEGAPRTDNELLTLINAEAKEKDGSDITNDIAIENLGGYDLNNPTEGTYVIQISVVGVDGLKITTTANLTIVGNGEGFDAIDMLATTPIVIAKGNGDTAAVVIDKYSNATVMESVSGAISTYSVGNETIVSDGGYDNNTNGTYVFKLETIGNATGLSVSKLVTVIVTDNPASVDASAVIDGQNIKILKGSAYAGIAATLHGKKYEKVTAEVTERGTILPVTLAEDSVITTNVNVNKVGEYATTFAYEDKTTFAAPVEAVKTLKVTIVDPSATNAVISGTDTQTDLADAPTSIEALLIAIKAEAKEVNGTDLTEGIKVLDFDGYDVTSPQVGEYALVIGVTGADGVWVTTTVNLKIVTDGEGYNSIEMLVTTPIVIANGSGDTAANVIDKYGYPVILEMVEGVGSSYPVGSETIVSTGGYDNRTNGTYVFKLETTGNESNLQVSRLVTVIVTDNPASVDANATIDGQDIKILKGSAYDGIAATLHGKKYEKVTAEVNESGTPTVVTLSDDNIVASNVNTNAVGEYTTTFAYKDENTYVAPVEAVKTLKVTVVDPNFATNAVISGTDTEVEIEEAPTTTEELLTTIKAEAKEVNGSDLTDDIKILDLGPYNLTTPQVGNYSIVIGVTGADGVMITTTVKLKVVNNGDGYNSIEMLVTTPIVIVKNSGETAANVIDKYGNPVVVENVTGNPNVYSVGSETIVSAGGYDNRTNGTYVFKLETTGTGSGLKVSRLVTVIVTDNPASVDASAIIDGQSIKVLKGSAYDGIAATLHGKKYADVTAEVTARGTLEPVTLSDANIVSSNVDPNTTGEYTTIFNYQDETSFAAPVEAVKSLKVTVVDPNFATNAVISGTDTEVELKDAPKTTGALLTTIKAEAKEANGTDITGAIKVLDLGRYDLTDPKTGNYPIVIGVIGSDGVMVTTTVNLKVVNNGAAINSIKMMVTTPIVIANGSGDTAANVIDKYGNPVVIETVADAKNTYSVGSETIVSSGGYDNRTNGTYVFKLETTGTETGLKVSRLVTVIVTDNPASVDANAIIDGQDITVLQGSYYTDKLATILHQENYDVVTAEVLQSGAKTTVSLNDKNIITSDVKTNVAGEYTTIFGYKDDAKYAAPVEAVKTLKVTVVPINEATNAVLSASDAESELMNAPASKDELLALLNAKAAEANGDDLSDVIEINTMGGYSFTAPAVGEYTIGLSVVGADGVKVVEIVTLTIVNDGDQVNAINMIVTTPIVIAKGSGETAANVIDKYGNAVVIEAVNGNPESYAVGSETIVSSGGYDNNTNGTYMFKLQTTGKTTELKVSRLVMVIVTDNPASVDASAVIDGKDIKILKGSDYDPNLALVLHGENYPNVTAEVTERGTLLPVTLNPGNIITMNVDQSKVGIYTTLFAYKDDFSYAAPVEAVKPLKVTVVEPSVSTNAVISATDAEVEITDAPTTIEQLLSTLKAEAKDGNGIDLTDDIKIVDLGGYDLTEPVISDYQIVLSVTGADGVIITTTANLKIVNTGEPFNSINMLVTTPIVIAKGSGDTAANVIDKYSNALVMESMSGNISTYSVGSETIVSNGGYNNNTNGTYVFKLQTTGKQSRLNVSRLVTVIVTSNPASVDASATINGQDIKILKGSDYDPSVAAALHGKKYADVTAEVTERGTIRPVTLNTENVVFSNADSSTVGEYQTTFGYNDETTFVAPVEAVRTLKVTVVDPNFETNAVISGTDTEIDLSDAPTTAAGLLTTLKAEAKEANGTNITGSIKIIRLDGYDLTSPQIGDYSIVIGVTGADGVMVTTTVSLKVVADGEGYNSIDMLVTTPIVIAKGSGETAANVIDKYGNPFIIESVAGVENKYTVGSETIVSNGGYKNNTIGTYVFKLESTGNNTGLKVSRLVTVIVTDKPATVDASAVIDGKDIKVLQGSYYDDTYAVVLHGSKYAKVTAEVTEKGKLSSVTLSKDNVVANKVNTTLAGEYTTTFAYDEETKYAAPVEAVKTLKVTVVAANVSTNAVISGTDTEVDLAKAPTTSANLLTTIKAQAKEVNGTDITNKIKIVDLGGYNLTTPKVGTYSIVISVTGADGVIVTTTVKLKVVADGAPYNTIDMLVTTPIVVVKGSGETAANVIDKYGNPIVIETVADDQRTYSVGSETIVSSGGYDNSTNGTYVFKLETTGTDTGLKVSRLVTVIVTDNPASVDASAVIDGQDIKVLKGSAYDGIAATLHANNYPKVTAKVTAKGKVTPVTLSDDYIVASDVKTNSVGEYTTTFAYNDKATFAVPVEAVKTLKVTVVDPNYATNAVISGTDTEVDLAKAPKTTEALLTTIKAVAKEANGTDITGAIKVANLGGYNLTTPKVGTYSILISVIGADGVMVTTTVKLKVVANGAATNSIEMMVTTPIVIANGSGETAANVIDKYGNPVVIETAADAKPPYSVGSETIVSNGGYDNRTNGTYVFKLETIGTVTGLKVSRLVTVIVTDNPSSVDASATIDGQDITVLQGSYYNNKIATILHEDKYDLVTAEVVQSGDTTPVSLFEKNVIYSGVNTKVAGEYTTTFGYKENTKYAAPVEAVKPLKVTVVPTDEATNAVLSASDAEVNLSKAPTSKEQLFALLNAQAAEANGDDLTDAIVVNTMGGYSFTAPAVGEYIIGLSVVGTDGVKVVEIVTLTVFADDNPVNAINMVVTTPIVIANGSGESAADVIDLYGNPVVIETIANKPESYQVGSETIVSSGGYDNLTNGTYMFKLQTTGKATGLKVSRLVTVIVTDNPTSVDASAVIDGRDIKVLKGSAYNNDLAIILHADEYSKVTAEVTESGTVTPVSLSSDNVLPNVVDTSIAGIYTTTFAYEDNDNFAAPVEAVKPLKVTVVDKNDGTNAIISGTDTEVELASAPTTDKGLLTTINADAVLADGTNVTNQIFVVDYDGYDLTSPTEGIFTITIGVVGSDGVLVTTEVNLIIVAEKDEMNEIQMLITTPVVVELGNGMDPKAVIEQLIYPTVVETERGKINNGYLEDGSTLVSDGGYDNNVTGTYYFKLQATGVKTGMEVEQLAKVIVTDKSNVTDVNAVIDGRDIELLVNSTYDVDNVSTLHAKKYDQVTAEVNASGSVNPVTLNGKNVVASDVVTKKPGTYQTVFFFKEEKTRSVVENVTAVKPLAVKVVDVNEGAEKIDFTKSVKSQDGKDIVSDNGTLDYTINIKNTSEDLVFNNLVFADLFANSELNIENMSDVKITDKNGADVTADYDINSNDKFAISIPTLRPVEELNITFCIKLDNDVTVKTIDNTATLTFDGKSKNSNTAKINTDYSDTEPTSEEPTSEEPVSEEPTSEETVSNNNNSSEQANDNITDEQDSSENKQMQIAKTGSSELFVLLIALCLIVTVRYKRA